MDYLYLLFFILSFQWVNSQNIGIVYESRNSFNHCNDNNLGIPEAPYIVERGTLKICNSTSKLSLDSIKVTNPASVSGTVYLPAMTIFKDYRNKAIHEVFEVDGDYYGVQREMETKQKDEWDIDRNKTKKILGIDCILAKKTNDRPRHCYEYAWFSEDIPYSDAFNMRHAGGLPGVVLEYYTENRESYSYRAIDIFVYKSCPYEKVPDYQKREAKANDISRAMTSGTAEFPYFTVDEDTPLEVWFSNL